MADFVESEAEESEQEEELNHHERRKLKKLKAIDSSEEEDDEDDEDRIREELKDLIDDNPIEESDGDDSDDDDDDDGSSRQKRKKSDDELDDRLEDEDYDLIEENLGVKVERRKFKRLRRIQDEESDGEEVQDQGQERDAIAMDLFSDDEDRRSERSHRQPVEPETFHENEEEGEYSDTDDFIVDDDGRPLAEKRKKRPIFTDTALQEAQETFGVDFDFDEFSKYGQDEYEEEDEEDEELEDEYEEDGGSVVAASASQKERRPKKKSRTKPARKSIFELYEPSELKRGFFTDLDNDIRNRDVPERMQIRDVALTSTGGGADEASGAANDENRELDDESEWIYKQAFCRQSVSNTDANLSAEARERQKKPPSTVGKIRKALDFMRNQQLEVPFIAFYRKEYVQPELNINDLWKVYKYDARWCQLKQRKTNLMTLFDKMRSYQTDRIMQDPDAPLPDGIRLISDTDMDRLTHVQTVDELQDIYHHFILYYGQDLEGMHEAWRRKERERKRAERRTKMLEKSASAETGTEERTKRNNILNDDDDDDDEDNDNNNIGNKDDLNEEDEEQMRRIKYANRSGSYVMCCRAGIDTFARKFGLTSEQYAENLRDNYQRNYVEEEPSDPHELAKEYVSKKFATVDDVLQAAKYVIAVQIAREPLVRKVVRELYFERAKFNVHPTKKGQKIIDETHNCYSLKYLKEKPVRDLTADQFLKLTLAEEENLLTLTFSDDIVGNTSASYVEEAKQLYLCEGFSKIVQSWNGLRTEAVERALTRCILPDLRNELRRTLITEAKDYILKACCRKLYNWIKIAPYGCVFSPDDDEDDWDTTKGVRVMGLSYVPDYTQAAFACIAAPDGEITDYLRLPNLLKRKSDADKDADLGTLKNFIAAKKPHVIAIGGESREALALADEMRQIIVDLAQSEQFPASVQVECVDNELAKVYANSNKGIADFREYPELLRQAVSLARRLQDPLIEFAQLCNGDDEILSLRFHTMQEQISRDDLLDAIRLEFVNRTNEVGVDINMAVQQPHKAYLVQFICGLGPRKGQALLRLLKQTNQRLENRTQLVTACHMGPKVFINCSGFIKIDTNGLGDSTEAYVEILDGSRVHPETYEWARKMAVDALEYDDDEGANPAGALEEILEAPERLKDLDLDAFAEELERQGFGNKSITLYDIRAELNCRYKDLRTTYRSANPEELFDMLTKETPDTFYIGKMVTACVVGIARRKPAPEQLDQANPVRNDETGLWQCPFCLKNDFPELSDVWNHFDAGSCPGQATGIKLRLDNGISGYIYIKNLSDRTVTNPEERVGIGQLIHCRITKIDVERFAVDCTSKSSDLVDKTHEWRPARDPFYDLEAEEHDLQTELETKKLRQRQTYVKRVIVHPAFHNISYVEAEKCMQHMDQGEVIVRPSSKGADHLTITWKVADNICQHIDIKEEGKTNAFSLGKSLWIGTEEFEDLDEIIARHVTPMAAFARDLLTFRYYNNSGGGHRDKSEEYLKEEKKKNPNKIHYVVSASKMCPGRFLLSYMPRAKVRHEFVTCTPEGYRFRQQLFDSVAVLFKWFKEHFRDPIPGGGGGSVGMVMATTPNTPRSITVAGVGGGGSVRTTPFQAGTTPTNMYQAAAAAADAIHRVAQNLPTHMMQTLTAVASQTPHYHQPHTPAAAYNYINTPYTPSGQTPFMTPYQQTPRYGHQTPAPPPPPLPPYHYHQQQQQQMDGAFLRPSGAATPSHHRAPASYHYPPQHHHHQPPHHPHHHQHQSRTFDDLLMDRNRPRSSQGKSPRSLRSTPRTNPSPHSMSLGDATPLYDESI